MGVGVVAANTLRFSAAVVAPALGTLVKGRCDSSTLDGKAGDRQRLAALAFSISMQVLGSVAANKLATSLSGSKSKAMRRFKKPVTVLTKTFSYALSPMGGYLLSGSSVAAKLRKPKENGKTVLTAFTCMDVFGRIFTWKPWVTSNTPESFNLLGLLSRSTAFTLKTELERDNVKNSFWVTGTYDDSKVEELHSFGMRISAILANQLSVSISDIVAPKDAADKEKVANYYFELNNLFSENRPASVPELELDALEKLHAFAINVNVHAHLADLNSKLEGSDFWLANNEDAEQKAKDVDLAEIHKKGFAAVQVLQRMLKQQLVSTTSGVDATTKDTSDLLAFYKDVKKGLGDLPLPKQLNDVKEKIHVLIDRLNVLSTSKTNSGDGDHSLDTANSSDKNDGGGAGKSQAEAATVNNASAQQASSLDIALETLAKGEDNALWSYETRRDFLNGTTKKSRMKVLKQMSTNLHKVLKGNDVANLNDLSKNLRSQKSLHDYWSGVSMNDHLTEKAANMVEHLMKLSDV